MSAARFKDLCLDANAPALVAGFWAAALGLTPPGDTREDGVIRLDPSRDRAAAETLWVNPVPEPRTAKTRVHVDVRLGTPEPGALLAAGATVVRRPGDDPWWVLADPEGNEFCAFAPRAGTRPGVFQLVVDSVDPPTQASWWAGVVGGAARVEGPVASVVGGAGFPWDFWVFAVVPEPKAVKNRMHWDVELAGEDPADLLRAGATLLREPTGSAAWWVLADPEGNEFCAFRRARR